MRLGTAAGLTIAAALALSPGAAAQAPGEPASVPRIPLAEFRKGLEAGTILVVDTRDAQSYRNGHIPGALSVPAAELEKRLPELRAAAKPVVTYCA